MKYTIKILYYLIMIANLIGSFFNPQYFRFKFELINFFIFLYMFIFLFIIEWDNLPKKF
jgi:hypothetical protein